MDKICNIYFACNLRWREFISSFHMQFMLFHISLHMQSNYFFDFSYASYSLTIIFCYAYYSLYDVSRYSSISSSIYKVRIRDMCLWHVNVLCNYEMWMNLWLWDVYGLCDIEMWLNLVVEFLCYIWCWNAGVWVGQSAIFQRAWLAITWG